MRVIERASAWARSRDGLLDERDSPGLCPAAVEVDRRLKYACLLPSDHEGEHRWMDNRGREVVYDRSKFRLATPEEIAVEMSRTLAATEAKVREYEAAIAWDTTCTSCAATLPALRAQEERAEKVEALLRDARAHLAVHRKTGQHDHLGEGLGCAGCELLTRIEEVTGG